jgi:acyl-coenzyme A synthetase/AMP-(fatty) acid ligase
MKLDQLKNFNGEVIIDFLGTHQYSDLLSQINEYKKILSKEHIKKGEVIIIESDYNFFSISLLLTLSELPNIIVPVVKTTEDEFKSKIQMSEANIIIKLDTKGGLDIDRIEDTLSDYKGYKDIIAEDNSGIVLFSSGTTGKPKLMAHNFSNLIGSFKAPRRQRKLRFILFLMFDHIGGLNTLLGCLNNGSSMVIPSDRNPEMILNLIETEEIQVLPTSPTFLNLMLQVENFDNYNMSSLKLITYGTEKMPQVLLNKINTLIPSVKLLQTFGTSETGILKTQSKSSSSLYFKIVDDEVDYRIENNQLFIKSKVSVKGYKDLESDKFDKEGWFTTGDLVEVDNEGYLKIIGRINDVINVGGLKVLPVEIEDVLNQIDEVIDSTVFARANAITGQIVCAKITIKAGTDKQKLKKLIRIECAKKLDKYKVPAKIIFDDKIKFTNRYKKTI